MTAVEHRNAPPLPAPDYRSVRWRLLGLCALVAVGAAALTAWALDGSTVGGWLAVHTGTGDLSGPWYGFWSGFGSDLAEFGLIGAVGTGVYQIVRKYNCHEPGCWRVGTHPAAGGQFLLCYRHHPDFHGQRPTHDMIERLHREHLARLGVVQTRVEEIRGHRAQPAQPAATAEAASPDRSADGRPG